MISIAGANGSVGRLVVAELARMEVGRIRLGGRRQEALLEVAKAAPSAEIFPFDLKDQEKTRQFCSGSDVVVNCAGPSSVLLDHLARAASAVEVPYVDVSGDEPVYQRLLSEKAPPTALLSAGVLPGLSSLVPRWMARSFKQTESLSTHVGGLERCSTSSTIDMIQSMDGKSESYGEPLAGWRCGRKVSKLLHPIKDMEIPFVPDRVDAYPFFSSESERLASDLGLDCYDFWNIFAGERLINTFIHYLGENFSEERLSQAVDDLSQAAALDLLGHKPYYTLVFQMSGLADDGPLVRTTAIQTGDAYHLIATMTALSALAVIEGKSTVGVGFASEMMDLDWAITMLRRSPAISMFEVVDGHCENEAAEEGTI